MKRAFPRQQVPQETFDVYRAELADVPAALLEEAVTQIIRSEEWFPTVAQIRAACAELALGLPSESDALAQIDARIVWAREGSHGAAPPIASVVVVALGQVGGYAAFRSSDSAVVRGQFGRIFRELRAAAILDAQLAPALEPAGRALGR